MTAPSTAPSPFLFPLDSEMWRINHQKCGLFFGPAAAILQIAHPRIARGVADHSNFESDALGRLERTLASTNRIAFGTREEADAVARRLREIHGSVRGDVPPGVAGGSRYSAFEPDLLLWVLATMIMAALQGYELVFGDLPPDRREDFYRDMRRFGVYFGLAEEVGPRDFEEFSDYYREMIDGDLLGSDPLCARLAHAIVSPGDSARVHLLGRALRFLPIETLPGPLRDRLGLRSTPGSRAAMGTVLRWAPMLFPRLPERLRMAPEARERLRREASGNRVGTPHPGN